MTQNFEPETKNKIRIRIREREKEEKEEEEEEEEKEEKEGRSAGYTDSSREQKCSISKSKCRKGWNFEPSTICIVTKGIARKDNMC